MQLSQPSLLTLDNLKANFNAIGTVKGRKNKEGFQQVERPDGRMKRFFTIADMNQFRTNSAFVELVVEALYDYLLRIEDIRGTGRLYLP